MDRRAIRSAIWGGANPPHLCANCEAASPVVCISNLDAPKGVEEPAYLCRKCFYLLIVRALEVHGALVLDVPQMLADIGDFEPLDPIAEEQARKQRDWRN